MCVGGLPSNHAADHPREVKGISKKNRPVVCLCRDGHGNREDQLGTRLFQEPRYPTGRRAGVGAVLLIWASLSLADAQPMMAPHAFDIPKQPLETAILAFAEQARIQVLLWTGPTSNVTSSGVRGLLSPIDALEAILTDTGLSYRQIDVDTVAIVYPEPAARRSVRFQPEQPSPAEPFGGHERPLLVVVTRFNFNPCRSTPPCDIKR